MTASAGRTNPVIFIHGLWIHSSAWEPWITLFAEHGYTATAPGWPGDGATVQETRDAPDSLNEVGIERICRHYADLIGTPNAKPNVDVVVRQRPLSRSRCCRPARLGGNTVRFHTMELSRLRARS
ncbi:alpha/beta fold hydrolase [Williamsia soli]|uniref:alpha/beta fold hydrolase n=1 Tax=Williamsia soli TaxID=364929 RepID=UPI001A9ED45F|nr:alpha/beta fold hydrolase [Williamsia soli]